MGRVMGRRTWLKAAAAGLGSPAWGRGAVRDDAAEVEARAKAVGIGPFGRSESEHYLAIGDAEKGFREAVVSACEAIATEFDKHYRARKFETTLPDGRMTVVVLADAKSYAKFGGEDAGLSVGGHYEPSTNRLVIFDYRSAQGELAANAERINSFTLSHETNHQLTFNTGLLDRAGDVPACVGEGLATYGETWRPKGRDTIGMVNRPRLKGLEGNTPWLRMERLFVEDKLFDDESTRDQAYAEAWLLVHSSMKEPSRTPRFQKYLAAIRGRKNAKDRLDDAQKHFGDLGKIDKALRQYAKSPRGR